MPLFCGRCRYLTVECECKDGPTNVRAGSLPAMASTMPDFINHPPHYNAGKIEVIDAIEGVGLANDFLLGSVMKYISRSAHKGHPIQDLEKAMWYLNRKIANLKKDSTGAES